MRLYLTLVQSKCDQNFISLSPLAWWSKGCRCWRQSAKVLQNLKIFLWREIHFYGLFYRWKAHDTTEYKTPYISCPQSSENWKERCSEIRKHAIYTVLSTNLAVSPSLSVKFFITLLILGKPQVFPARNTISLIISIYFHSHPNNKGHTLKRIRSYSIRKKNSTCRKQGLNQRGKDTNLHVYSSNNTWNILNWTMHDHLSLWFT